MNNCFINYKLLQSLNIEKFKQNKPFPWFNFQSFLTPEAFRELYLSFPPLEIFEKHVGMERGYGQRPHNRYYLAYEDSIYNNLHRENNEGIVKKVDLPIPWQRFIEELETNQIYNDFIKSAFEVSNYHVRYAWHLGFNGSEVSPHQDSKKKIGTHIFYFNNSEDWETTWGGSTLVLGGKSTNSQNPEFEDFTIIKSTQVADNYSFLFKNTVDSWHGVRALTCPPGKFRKLFNVIYEFPETPESSNRIYLNSPLIAGKKFFQKVLKNLK
jgi:hypothetical protein